jgi:hypothetical protein
MDTRAGVRVSIECGFALVHAGNMIHIVKIRGECTGNRKGHGSLRNHRVSLSDAGILPTQVKNFPASLADITGTPL